jgi:hypothetical protein
MVTLVGAVSKGDLVGYSAGWQRACGDVTGVIQAKGVALMDGKIRDKIPVSFGKTIVGGRLSGMTIGNPLYSAEGTDYGMYTDTLPTDLNDATKVVGYAISTTEAIIDCNVNVDTLSAGS